MLYDSKELSKVSPNLSLRLSPERKCPPCRYPLSCIICHCCPCICCKICHYLPCRCIHYSPVRCCSPCHIRTIRPCSPCANPCRRACSPVKNVNPIYNSPERRINYNEYEERQFNDFLRKLMAAESQIEDAKINLALNPDFNCEDAFRIFELNGRGFIDECDLKCGLNLIGIFPTDYEVRLLMKRFDLQKQGYLNYGDFFDMLVPYEKDYRTMVENRLPNSCCPCRCPDIFCCATICSLKNVFNIIISLETDINDNRKLFGTLRIKLRDIFRLLDYPDRGFFSNNDLIVYLQKNFIFSSNKDADLLFIRLDKNRNGDVFYGEIEDLLKENIDLKNQLNINSKYNFEEYMVVTFISQDETVNKEIICLPSDIFADIEKELYEEYYKLAKTDNKFTVNEKPILRFKTLSENGIKNGDKILLSKIE